MRTIKSLPLKDWKDIYESNKDFIVIDIRAEDDFDREHVKRSININYQDPNFISLIDKLDKKKSYLVYCKSGFRCSKTLELMGTLEFEKAYGLEGGIDSWKDSRLKVEK